MTGVQTFTLRPQTSTRSIARPSPYPLDPDVEQGTSTNLFATQSKSATNSGPARKRESPKKKKGKKNKKTIKATKRKGAPRSRLQGASRREQTSDDRLHNTSRRLPDLPPPQLVHPHDHLNHQRLERDTIGCSHFGQCSGCVVDQNVGDVELVKAAQLYFSSTAVRRKRQDVLQQALPWVVETNDDGFYQVVVPSPVRHWRTQAKLAVAPAGGSSRWLADRGCILGLYQRGSHQVIPIPDCSVHHPAINQAVDVIQKATALARTPVFTTTDGVNGLRYVQLQVDRSTGRICLTLVWHAATLKQTQPGLARLVKQLQQLDKSLWHSIWCHCNDSLGNNIFHRNPRRWHQLVGPEFLRERLPSLMTRDQSPTDESSPPPERPRWLYFSPLAFRQGNLQGFEVLALEVARLVPPGAKVCELYAGVGVLGLTSLAHHYDQAVQRPSRRGWGIDDDDDEDHAPEPLTWLRCSDENPANPRCFARAVDSLPFEMTGKRSTSSSRRRGPPSTSRAVHDDDAGGMSLAQLAQALASGKNPSAMGNSKKGDANEGEKTSYLVASATQALRAGEALGANVLIVDPPRKGLDQEVVTELCKPFNPQQPYVESRSLLTMPDHRVSYCNDVRKLIYVSCGLEALLRDCEALLSSPGGWVLTEATGYILFPGSNHVETLCVFERE